MIVDARRQFALIRINKLRKTPHSKGLTTGLGDLLPLIVLLVWCVRGVYRGTVNLKSESVRRVGELQ
jgi:hypothetical protein